MKKITGFICMCLLMSVMTFASTNALACPGGQIECAPRMTPIIDQSGIKPKTAEERSVRKAADHFLRMELSSLMMTYGYESVEAFIPIGKKYINIPIDEWIKRKTTPTSLMVCDKATLIGWKKISEKKYQFEYQLQSVIEHHNWDKPSSVTELKQNNEILKIIYIFNLENNRLKLMDSKTSVNAWFELLSEYTKVVQRRVKNNGFVNIARTAEQEKQRSEIKKIQIAEYEFLKNSNQKFCN